MASIYHVTQGRYRTFSSLQEVLSDSTGLKCLAHIASHLVLYDRHCLAQITSSLSAHSFHNRILYVVVLRHLTTFHLGIYSDLKISYAVDCDFHLFNSFTSLLNTDPMPCTWWVFKTDSLTVSTKTFSIAL